MSARDDATLSAAERAALAGLESQAEADDPRLAAQLRGGGHRGLPSLRVPPGLVRALRTWLGPLCTLGGLVVAILAVSQSTIVALGGALVFVAGMLLSAALVRSGLDAALHVAPGRQSDGEDGETTRPGGL